MPFIVNHNGVNKQGVRFNTLIGHNGVNKRIMGHYINHNGANKGNAVIINNDNLVINKYTGRLRIGSNNPGYPTHIYSYGNINIAVSINPFKTYTQMQSYVTQHTPNPQAAHGSGEQYAYISAGRNTYGLKSSILPYRWCLFKIYMGSYTPSIQAYPLLNVSDGYGNRLLTEVSVEYCVKLGIIAPLVLIWSTNATDLFAWHNILNWYTGTYPDVGCYPQANMMFQIADPNCIISSIVIDSTISSPGSYSDGFLVWSLDSTSGLYDFKIV